VRRHILPLVTAAVASLALEDLMHPRTEKMSVEQYAAAKEAERLERQRQRLSEEEWRRRRQLEEDAKAAPYREARRLRRQKQDAQGMRS
jgi:hypothetical protein